MNVIIQPLDGFYIAGSVLMLVLAITIYPTLKDQAKKRKKRV